MKNWNGVAPGANLNSYLRRVNPFRQSGSAILVLSLRKHIGVAVVCNAVVCNAAIVSRAALASEPFPGVHQKSPKM